MTPNAAAALERLQMVIGSLRNFADVADRCVITEVVNSIPAMRLWADEISEIFDELASIAQQGEAVAWMLTFPGGGFCTIHDKADAEAHAREYGDKNVAELYSTPVAHSPAAVDEAMEKRARDAFWRMQGRQSFGPGSDTYEQFAVAMRAALTAALLPATSEGENNG